MNKYIILLIFLSVSIFSKEDLNIDSLKFAYMQWPVQAEFPDKIELSEKESISIDTEKLTIVIFTDTSASTIEYCSKYFNKYLSNKNLEIIFVIESEKEINIENWYFEQIKKFYFQGIDFRKKYKLGTLPRIYFIHNNKLNYIGTTVSDRAKIAMMNYMYGRLECFE